MPQLYKPTQRQAHTAKSPHSEKPTQRVAREEKHGKRNPGYLLDERIGYYDRWSGGAFLARQRL